MKAEAKYSVTSERGWSRALEIPVDAARARNLVTELEELFARYELSVAEGFEPVAKVKPEVIAASIRTELGKVKEERRIRAFRHALEYIVWLLDVRADQHARVERATLVEFVKQTLKENADE